MNELRVVHKRKLGKVTVGYLKKIPEGYVFEYDMHYLENNKRIFFAKVKGNKFINNKMFAFFKSRLPDEKRPDIQEILKSYGLKEYDDFELLARTKGKIMTDNYEFEKMK
jgi:HipA-like protein